MDVACDVVTRDAANASDSHVCAAPFGDKSASGDVTQPLVRSAPFEDKSGGGGNPGSCFAFADTSNSCLSHLDAESDRIVDLLYALSEDREAAKTAILRAVALKCGIEDREVERMQAGESDLRVDPPAHVRQVLSKMDLAHVLKPCLLYTSPSPRDGLLSRMPSSA